MKIKLGNDVKRQATIMRLGVAEDFSGATDIVVKVYKHNGNCGYITASFVRTDNVFDIYVLASTLTLGVYDCEISYKTPDSSSPTGIASHSTSYSSMFTIVSTAEEEDDEGQGIIMNVGYVKDGESAFVYIASASDTAGSNFNYPANISQDYLAILNSTTEIPEPSVTDFEGLWFSKIDAYRAAQIGGYTGTQEEFFLELASVQGLPDIIEDAIAATTAANNAAILADEKAGLADQKATEANNAANSANGAAMAANQATNNAIEATESISETEQTVQANEALRVEAEGDATKGRVKAENDRVTAEIARNVVSNIYNVTLAVPLTAGQYYTSTTARAAVPSGVRKRGLELVYETSAGVWYCERFIGANVTTWTTSTDWEVVPTKKYVDDAGALKVNNTTLENTEEVTAEALVQLKNRIDALQKIIQDMILGSVQIDSLNIVKTLNLYGSSNMILTGSAAPAVVPDFIGQFFIKTSATTACYQATGNSAVGDWKQIG